MKKSDFTYAIHWNDETKMYDVYLDDRKGNGDYVFSAGRRDIAIAICGLMTLQGNNWYFTGIAVDDSHIDRTKG